MAEPAGSGGERGDWTERIPGLGRLSERGRQLVLLIVCLILIAVLGAVIYLTPANSAGSTRGTPTPSASTTAPTNANPTMGGTELPTGPEAPESNSIEPSESTAPEASTSAEPDDEHDHSGPYGPDPTPIYSPTSSRSAESADEAEGKAVLAKVVPAWAEADFSDERPDDAEDSADPTADKRRAWVASWREEGAVKQPFVGLSTKRFVPLWSGAMQMRAKVSDAKITESELLWRVTVQRTVAAPGVSSTEEVSWDFQITQDGSNSALVSFAEPDSANEDPDTYRPANP